jgi:DnaJ-class molecular chaperone
MSWDPYAALGVARTASAEEIRAAYRRKAKTLHPDLHPNDPAKADAFKRVSAAAELLGDAEKRARFDRGEIDADGQERMRGFSSARGFSGAGPAGAQGDPMEDILESLFGGRGGRGRPGPGPRKGADVRYRAEVSFEDAVTGARRRIVTGDGRTLEIDIPAGVETGKVLRLAGQGAPGPGGGPPGHALVELVVGTSPLFRREGVNLLMDLPISLRQAVEGGEAVIQAPTGAVTLKIPEGSNTGQTLRLKGRGVQVAPDPGHILVTLRIVLNDPKDGALRRFVQGQSVN